MTLLYCYSLALVSQTDKLLGLQDSLLQVVCLKGCESMTE